MMDCLNGEKGLLLAMVTNDPDVYQLVIVMITMVGNMHRCLVKQ